MELTHSNHLITKKIDNGWAIVRLNRPKALQALDQNLIASLYQAFSQLEQDPSVRAIWFDSNTPKAFCAGGDVLKLRQSAMGDMDSAIQFFNDEYQLDLYLHQYKKPIVAWGEGYIMGGGLGLFMASTYRIVTHSSKLAMPEINIGLYPDVGATRFLADCGRIGLFVGMTGALVGASSAYNIAWATHIMQLSGDEVLATLQQINWDNYRAGDYRAIDDVLRTLHRPIAPGPLQESIDTVQSVCRGEDFLQDYRSILALKDANSVWLRQASENLALGSPVTAAITWLLWQWGTQNRSWQEVFALENQISAWKVAHPDFNEGVRARLVDKDLSPNWIVSEVESLQQVLADFPPKTDIESFNAILRKYQVI